MSSWRRPATAIRPINVRTCRQLAQDPAICRRSSFGRTSPWEPARLQGEMSPAARRSRIRSALPAIAAIAALFDRLDQMIARMKAATHRPKVELLAHSLGTFLMQDYLNSSRQRAANVAHYVNIDGRTADSPPGGVPTLAVFGTRGPLSDQPG